MINTILNNFKLGRNPNKEFSINLTISNVLPEDFDPKNRIGTKSILLWENNGIRASKIITDEIPIQIYYDFKAFFIKVHNRLKDISFNFTIGTYHIIVNTPYICRLQLIEYAFKENKNNSKIKDDFKKKYKIKNIIKEYGENTKIIEATIYVDYSYNNNKFAQKIYYMLVQSFHNEQLKCLEKYMVKDIIDIIRFIL